MYKNVALDKKKVEKFFEEGVGFGITYHGENDQGRCVLSAKIKNPELEREKNDLIERKFSDNPKEGLIRRHYLFTGYGVSYEVERISDKDIVKTSYFEPIQEEERKKKVEQGKKRQKKENFQLENSQNSETRLQEVESVFESSNNSSSNSSLDFINSQLTVIFTLIIGMTLFIIGLNIYKKSKKTK